MAYQQLHVGKVKLNGIGGIYNHHAHRDKVKSNGDIDLSRSELNYSIEGLTVDNLTHRVHQRIKDLKLKRKPRSDAVGLMDIVVGSSAEYMLTMEEEERQKYFADALHFFQKHYGVANVMYCQCHLDESNPHIHVGVMPVTSDGRLSAREMFNPQTLEQLQTFFHCEVSSKYGLERGEHHAKDYLEVNKFKAKKLKEQIAQYSVDLETADINQQQFEQVKKSAHYSSTGIVFKTEDRENVELPTDAFLSLRNMAEEGVKAVMELKLLREETEELKREKLKALSDLSQYRHELKRLEQATLKYMEVPEGWRNSVDVKIRLLKNIFQSYCHDLNRAIVRVYIANKGNMDKTEQIVKPLLESVGVGSSYYHVMQVIGAAKKQRRTQERPQEMKTSSWTMPKPSSTNYSQADETTAVRIQLGEVEGVNWEMINWDLLSELDKDELRQKKILREL